MKTMKIETVKIKKKIADEFANTSKRTGISKSFVMREAIKKFIIDNRDLVKTLEKEDMQ